MPIYRYACECGNSFDEFFHRVGAPETFECKCGKDAKYQIGASAIKVVDWVNNADDQARHCGVPV